MKILMVCLGNICRSPMAEGIMQHFIDENNLPWQVDSAGTGSWHSGEQPDKRAIKECESHGIEIWQQKARQLSADDFTNFDVILAMDTENLNEIHRTCPASMRHKVNLVMNFAYPNENRAVPDPYYDGSFANVYSLLHHALNAFVEQQVNVVHHE